MSDETRKVVGRFAKNSRGEEIVVDCHEWKGKPLVSIRTWYADRETGELKPGREGFSIHPDRIADLESAIAAARKEAERRGWLSSISSKAQAA